MSLSLLVFLWTLCNLHVGKSQSCTTSTTSGDLRLIGGSSANEGRVEIFYSGQWGTVCHDGWGSDDAKVACRQLGYDVDTPGATYSAHCCAYYGRGSGSILLDGVGCSGAESSLLECSHRGLYSHYCGHHEDAGVMCSGDVSEGDIRLSNGLIPQEGIVQVYLNGMWRGVCDSYWDYRDVLVVCRQLGYPATDAVPYSNAYFGEHIFPNITNIYCNGNESRLLECQYCTTSTCGGSDTAGVRCQGDTVSMTDTHCIEGTIRLAGGEDENEGRVEICSNGLWGTICGRPYGWDMNAATIVCRQLGYQNGRVSAYQYSSSTAKFGEGNGPILLVYIYYLCDGTEASIQDCTDGGSSYLLSCTHYYDVGVRCENISAMENNCTDGEVRLAGGQNDADGRVEICVGGIWGSVCDDSWDNRDAAVVCQQLGFQGNNVTAYTNAYFGEGKGPYHLTNVGCYGDEESLLSCSYSRYHHCEIDEDAGVTCHEESPCEHGDMRLVGGSMEYEGRVEICDNGRWGTVCDYYTYDTLLSVVCRQLAGDDALSVTFTSAFPGGTGVPILYNFDCSGAASRVQNCSYSKADYNGFSSSRCYHGRDISVRCYVPSNCTTGDVRLVDGENEMEGRVEICKDGVWGAITDSYWDRADAKVTCRQLGYPSEWSIALTGSYVGRGNSPILVHYMRCDGDEGSLEECYHYTVSVGTTSYSTYAVAGVICQGNATSETECSSGDLRLVGGESESEGRVEVCVDGFWGTVCDQNWGQREAIVACRQAGLPSSCSVALNGALFGEGSGPIVSTSCSTGKELGLGECTSNAFPTNCHHGRDAGVVRLASSKHYTISTTTDPAGGQLHIGDVVTLHCSVDPPPPEGVTYTWTTSVPGVYPSTTDSTFPNATIKVPVHHPSNGRYYCHVSDSGILLGVGYINITVHGLLYPIGEDIVQYTPPGNVTLKVGLTPSDASYYFRLLTWYHDGVELVNGGRIMMGDFNTTITITDTSEDDSGVYEAKYNGLLVHPYDRICEGVVIDLLRHYPLLKPAVFHIYTDPSDIYNNFNDISSGEVSFVGYPESIYTLDENVTLAIEGTVHTSIDERVTTTWYFNGGPLPPGTSLGPLKGPLLSLSQELDMPRSTLLDVGFYEVTLTINTYSHLISHLQCPQEYYDFISYTADIDNIVLDAAMVHMKYYEPPLATLGASKEAFTVNENVTITCTASDGYPPVSSISMTKNGELLAATESNVLHINTDTVVGTRFGEYICVVNNSVIAVEKAVLLKEKGVLQIKLTLGVSENCDKWDNSTIKESASSLEESLAEVIGEQCLCDFNTSDLTGSYLKCSASGSNDFTFMTTIVYSSITGDTTATTLVGKVENWAANTPNPTLAVGMETAVVEEVCGMEECVMDTTTDQEEESNPAAIAGSFIGGITAGTILIVIPTVIICIIMKKKQSSNLPVTQPHQPSRTAGASTVENPDHRYQAAIRGGKAHYLVATGGIQLGPTDTDYEPMELGPNTTYEPVEYQEEDLYEEVSNEAF